MHTRAMAGILRERAVLPNHASWFLLAGALDIMVTATILARFGGREVNGIAHAVIEAGGLPGLVAFKFASAVVVIVAWEWVARVRLSAARRLASWAVVVAALPVVAGLAQVAGGVLHGHLPLE